MLRVARKRLNASRIRKKTIQRAENHLGRWGGVGGGDDPRGAGGGVSGACWDMVLGYSAPPGAAVGWPAGR
jgi:hypothetical protein